MIRGTTPVLTFKINTELDLSEIDKAEITFKSVNGMKKKVWYEDRLIINPQENTMQLPLTQEETLYFKTGKINVQLRIKMQDAMVYASKIITTTLEEVENEEVI